MLQGMSRTAAALIALNCGAALADASGAIKITSEYMYRGYEQSLGAAVQGTLNWQSSDNGLYAGAFISNNSAFGGSEIDYYGGWQPRLTEKLRLDIGGVYYQFSEDHEKFDFEGDYYEVYAGLQGWGATARFYYTPEYLSDESQDAYYLYADYVYELRDKLALKPQAGYSYGSGFENLAGLDHLYDYSLSLSYDFGQGYTANFGAYDSTLPEDDVKLVVSLTKGFDL